MKKWIAAVAALAMLFVLTACGKVTFEEYTFENQPFEQNNYNVYDSDLTIDAVKEDAYGDSVYRLNHMNAENAEIYMDVYMYFGEKGVSVFLAVHDSAVFYVPERDVYANSSIEFFLATTDKSKLDSKTLQFRVSCDGTCQYYVGAKSQNAWLKSWFHGMSAVKVNGTMNTTDCEGFDVELFVPWEQLGLESVPQELFIYPAMNHVSDESLTLNRIRTAPPDIIMAEPSSWLKVKAEGGMIYNEGDTFGSAAGFRTWWGFDLSGDNAEGGYSVDNTRTKDQYAYFKDVYADCFYAETKVHYTEMGYDAAPKFGIHIKTGDNVLFWCLKGNVKYQAVIAQRDITNSSWDWTDAKVINVLSASEEFGCFKEGGTTTLAVYKDGNEMYFMIDGRVICAQTEGENPYGTTPILRDMEGSATVGLLCMGSETQWSDYSVAVGEEARALFDQIIQG